MLYEGFHPPLLVHQVNVTSMRKKQKVDLRKLKKVIMTNMYKEEKTVKAEVVGMQIMNGKVALCHCLNS